jgi:hypothetical protein
MLQSPMLDIQPVMQTITAAGVVGLIGWAFRFSARQTRIETVLLEPDLGIVPRMKGIAKQGHDNAGILQAQGSTLELHGAELARLEREKEPRHSMQPADVGRPDRRGP